MSDSSERDPLGEVFGDLAGRLREDRWQPDVDVFETESDVVVRAEIGGVRGEDLRVTVDGMVLKIAGVRPPPEPSNVKRLHQMEIATGAFERRIRISIPFERGRVSAHLADGFLTVVLPKRAAGPRPVSVES